MYGREDRGAGEGVLHLAAAIPIRRTILMDEQTLLIPLYQIDEDD